MEQQGYQVYVPEHRGHGRSSAPVSAFGGYHVIDDTADVLAILDALGIEEADKDFCGSWATCQIDDEAFCGAIYEQVKAISLDTWSYIFAGIEKFDNRTLTLALCSCSR